MTPADLLNPDHYIKRFFHRETLLPDNPNNVLEVVGILKSYGIVLDAYSKNLIYTADHQFLVLFPFFKYFNGEVSTSKLLQHWWHQRINFEYAEYCAKTMLWHGGGGLETYLESPEFKALVQPAIAAKIKGNLLYQGIQALFPDFWLQLVIQGSYWSALGQFWRVMSDIFIALSDRYDTGEIQTIPAVVDHIKAGLVAAANRPITYQVEIGGQSYDIIPPAVGLTFLPDTAIPYVESVFFRGTPFPGTISYNAQARQIPVDQGIFNYGALYADPVPIGGSGIPPTLLMQDMRHFLPDYLVSFYEKNAKGQQDLLVVICQSFQKSMFCVTNAAIVGLAPYPLTSEILAEKEENYHYLSAWMKRLQATRLFRVQELET